MNPRDISSLRWPRELLAEVIDSAPIGMALVALDGSVMRVNRALCEIVGCGEEDLLGTGFTELAHPDDVEATLEQMRRIIITEIRTCRLQNRCLRRDGRVVWVKLSVSLVRDERGEPAHFICQLEDATEAREAEQALQRSEARLADRELQLVAAQALAHLGSWEWVRGQPRVSWSDELCRIFGRTPGFAPTFEQALEMIHPEDRTTVVDHFKRAESAHQSDNAYRILRPDGEVRYVHAWRHGRAGQDGTVSALFGAVLDVTERKRAELELRTARDYSEEIVAAISEGYGLTIDGCIEEVNETLCRMTGFAREELIGSSVPFPFWPPEQVETLRAIRDRVASEQGGTFETTLMRKDGIRFDAEITARPARNPDGSFLGLLNTIRDVSERKRYEAELRRLANSDSLTELANHRVFHERLSDEVTRATRHARPLCVAILDLDHFKRINDRFGHLVGDSVLAEVARRLSRLVRSEELLARVGGEEFAWLLPDADEAGAYAAAERARRAIELAPFEPVGAVTISAGVCGLAKGQDAPALYHNADQALYEAKRLGRNRTCRYNVNRARELGRGRGGTRHEPLESMMELALGADAKLPWRAGHARRVADLASRLAALAGWTPVAIMLIHDSALVHDIGTIAIPESILAKPQALSPPERARVQTHPAVGAEILLPVLTAEQVSWVRHHHERWDGAGYPDGLAADAIPEGAQLLALADAYDAMTHDRPYRRALTPQLATLEVRDQAARQFSPGAVRLLDIVLGE